jgi:hypothetical protein
MTSRGKYDPTPSEVAMLDDIEATTARIYGQTRILKGEAEYHNDLLTSVSSGLEKGTARLQEESAYIARVRKQTEHGICWMYAVVAIETLTLVFLLYNGI